MQALNDGKIAIAKDPKFARGYHRAAKAYLTMGKFSQVATLPVGQNHAFRLKLLKGRG